MLQRRGGFTVRSWLVVAVMAGSLLVTASAQASGWVVKPTPAISGGDDVVLNSVSCASGASCSAVGSYLNGQGTPRPLAETWDGHTWTMDTVPVPASESTSVPTRATLNGVSCAAPDACTAVGSYVAPPNVKGAPLVERWNGSHWTRQTAPVPADYSTFITLNGVSCLSATSCTAVGDYDVAGVVIALAEQWNGSTWSIQATPEFPPDPGGGSEIFLNGVSCRSANFCMAVGSGGTPTKGDGTLALRWNGTTWSIQRTPDRSGVHPREAGYAFEGVSCAAGPFCAAVGVPALANSWDGSSWTGQFIPANTLLGVSCPSSTSCTAVGSNGDSTRPSTLTAAVSIWNGSNWTSQVAPSPYGADQLNGVSCKPSGVCTAVGESSRGALVERYVPPTP
jgi:hypothetical protein